MAATSNMVNLQLDIQGSLNPLDTLSLADEPLGYGLSVGVTGAAGSLNVGSLPTVTLTDTTADFTALYPGQFIQITVTDATAGANNGVFEIIAIPSTTTLQYVNASAVASTAVGWSIRLGYSALDDFNFARTDRKAIKGTTNYYDPIPTYTLPTATATAVPANLSNISGKTLDAHSLIVSQLAYGVTVASTNTHVTITQAGALKHSSTTDRTGVPCFDVAPYVGLYEECYVFITDPATGSEIINPANQKTVFGITKSGSSTSPNSVEIHFYEVAPGANIATASAAFTWAVGMPTTINAAYGYNYRMDQLPEAAFRRIMTLGIMSDADLRNDIDKLQTAVGVPDEVTHIGAQLTNKTSNYPFFALGATPSVVNALQVLNDATGNLTFTGAILNAGPYTVTSALQALASAIVGSQIIRVTERVTADIAPNTTHTIPVGVQGYGFDNSGTKLFVYVRGILQDAGIVANKDQYQEVSDTQLKFYAAIKKGPPYQLL